MGVPESSFAVAAFIVLALPGFIYGWVRRWLRGEYAHDRDVGLAVARGAAFAVALTSIYLVMFGELLITGVSFGPDSDALSIRDPRGVGLTVLVLYVIVPFLLSTLSQLNHIGWRPPAWLKRAPEWVVKCFSWMRVPHSKHGYSSVPTAWDYAVTNNQAGWVSVRRSDGSWVGGWYSGESFVSTYPEKPSIYIHRQHAMTDKGEFGDELPDSGVLVMISDGDSVHWTREPVPETQKGGRNG